MCRMAHSAASSRAASRASGRVTAAAAMWRSQPNPCSARSQASLGGTMSNGEKSSMIATVPARPNWPSSTSSQKLGSAVRRSCGTMSSCSAADAPNCHRNGGELRTDEIAPRRMRSAVRCEILIRSESFSRAIRVPGGGVAAHEAAYHVPRGCEPLRLRCELFKLKAGEAPGCAHRGIGLRQGAVWRLDVRQKSRRGRKVRVPPAPNGTAAS